MRGPVLLAGYYVFSLAASACVPDVPRVLIYEKEVLEHEVVIEALQNVQRYLSERCTSDGTRDGVSIAIVHASSPTPIYKFNNGTLKFNDTNSDPGSQENTVTSDSIFRINSVTKTLTVTSALVLEQKLRRATPDGVSELTLDSRVRRLLPSFVLQPLDWADGGSDITLRMLASHTAGIPRESYSTDFDMLLGASKADAKTIGARWAGQSAKVLVEGIARKGLMFPPGQRAAYSNAGIGLLGAAVAAYYSNVTGSELPWSDLATREILEPLNMTHSFVGAVPQHLIPHLSIPGGENWADLIVGEGYDPAAGMWSSANDLASYLYRIWLAPEPELITTFQRRDVLKQGITEIST